MPGRQHEPQRRRRPHQQQLQLPQRLRRAQMVHIIDHQPDPIFQRRQVLQQPLHHRPAVQVWRRRQLPHQPRPRRGLPQRAQHRQPEPLRIPLLPPHRHPRGAALQARLADPGPQQHRLPAPRRRRHHRHPRPRPKPPEQPNTRNDSSRTRGDSSTGLRPPGRPHRPIITRTPGSAHRPGERGQARDPLAPATSASWPCVASFVIGHRIWRLVTYGDDSQSRDMRYPLWTPSPIGRLVDPSALEWALCGPGYFCCCG